MWGENRISSIEAAMDRRPPHVKPPSHWRKSAPAPEPGRAADTEENGGPKGKEPTRYGDWESNGRCWDF
jgi:hypothetical protein